MLSGAKLLLFQSLWKEVEKLKISLTGVRQTQLKKLSCFRFIAD
jgi:hypothetical protein